MEISNIRRENLRCLMRERFGGKQAKIADALDKSPNYISRCLSTTMALSHRKNIGEDFAREIEDRLGLARYSMDIPQGTDPATIQQNDTAEQAPAGEPFLADQVPDYIQAGKYKKATPEHRKAVDDLVDQLLDLSPAQALKVKQAMELLIPPHDPRKN